ncbi:hypothetical protein ACFL6Q_01325 [Candidatus Neomarinimicrobiota bacterium]
MKLGIIVVYMVREENERLLDLHLHQIEKHTHCPYTIYGTANRLLPQFRRKLEEHPNIKICEFPATDLRTHYEHAYYLDRLVQAAIEDGVSHVVTLHVDSFPIRTDWIQIMTDQLSAACPLVSVMRQEINDLKPNTAGLCFNRDFYLDYQPTFLLSNAERSSKQYQEYCAACDHLTDSGVGYGFKIFSEGLSWYPLMRSNEVEDHAHLGSIYHDIIYHLSYAARRVTLTPADRIKIPQFFRGIRSVLIPEKIWEIIRNSSVQSNQQAYDTIRARLLENPDAYLEYLRTGQSMN